MRTKRNASEDDDVVHEVCLNYSFLSAACCCQVYVCVCAHADHREGGGTGKVFTDIYAHG